MKNSAKPAKKPKKTLNEPHHIEFDFRREAFIWVDDGPLAPNLYSTGFQLLAWMSQKGQVHYLIESDKKLANSYTNPFTYDASTLAQCYQTIINDAHDFSTSTDEICPSDAEVRYIRLRAELILYGTRLCEALIKQLLHCTTFPSKDYKRAALGRLLSSQCRECKKKLGKEHNLSLLGSVAHRYGLCRSYDDCVHSGLIMFAGTRNREAAHSGVAAFHQHPPQTIRKIMGKELVKIGKDVQHILKHISDFEIRMVKELDIIIDRSSKAYLVVNFRPA